MLCGAMSYTGAVPRMYFSSPSYLALIVIRPACELTGHSITAKSAAVQRVSAFGFPNTPSGALNVTFFAASGLPGFLRANVVVRSGCVPASVSAPVELVVSNDSISIEACAGAANAAEATAATKNAIRRLLVIGFLPCRGRPLGDD